MKRRQDFQRRGKQWLPDVRLAMQNLGARKLRALLTMLGIIFGVAAVVSMLSIGAGAQQQVLAFIEQLGVHNLIVEAKDVPDTGRSCAKYARLPPACPSRISG